MIDQAIDLLKKMHSETRYSQFDFCEDQTREYLNDVVNKNQFITVRDGGIMIGSLSEMFFSKSLCANDVLIYVDKDHRKSGLAKSMLLEFIEWAKSHGAAFISVGQTTGVEEKGYSQLMKSIGAVKCGVVYEVF